MKASRSFTKMLRHTCTLKYLVGGGEYATYREEVPCLYQRKTKRAEGSLASYYMLSGNLIMEYDSEVSRWTHWRVYDLKDSEGNDIEIESNYMEVVGLGDHAGYEHSMSLQLLRATV